MEHIEKYSDLIKNKEAFSDEEINELVSYCRWLEIKKFDKNNHLHAIGGIVSREISEQEKIKLIRKTLQAYYCDNPIPTDCKLK